MTVHRDVTVTGLHLSCGLCAATAHPTAAPGACLPAMGRAWMDGHLDPHLIGVDLLEDGEATIWNNTTEETP